VAKNSKKEQYLLFNKFGSEFKISFTFSRDPCFAAKCNGGSEDFFLAMLVFDFLGDEADFFSIFFLVGIDLSSPLNYWFQPHLNYGFEFLLQIDRSCQQFWSVDEENCLLPDLLFVQQFVSVGQRP
jgi:hypothetical protein